MGLSRHMVRFSIVMEETEEKLNGETRILSKERKLSAITLIDTG